MLSTVPLKRVERHLKYIGINLNKDMQYLYNENSRILKTVIFLDLFIYMKAKLETEMFFCIYYMVLFYKVVSVQFTYLFISNYSGFHFICWVKYIIIYFDNQNVTIWPMEFLQACSYVLQAKFLSFFQHYVVFWDKDLRKYPGFLLEKSDA